MHMRRISKSVIALLATHLAPAQTFTAADARNDTGPEATAHYAASPTFTNLDEPCPNQVFTTLIGALMARNPSQGVGT
jgi:hypothetical protein